MPRLGPLQAKKRTLSRVLRLHKLFHDGKIPTLAQHEVHPDHPKGSRENFLYFTLPPCINFQRNSPLMWQSALKTWNDPITRYVFFPELVVKKSFSNLQRDLYKHRLSLQPNKHTEIWTRISHTLHEYYQDDPRQIIHAGEADAAKIIQHIQTDQRDRFLYLRGSKLTNYWLFILSIYTDVRLRNTNAISIIPDTHVLQSSLQLGITQAATPQETVAALWKELLKDSPLNPVDMHPVLWNWSRNGFQPKV